MRVYVIIVGADVLQLNEALETLLPHDLLVIVRSDFGFSDGAEQLVLSSVQLDRVVNDVPETVVLGFEVHLLLFEYLL